MRLIDADALYDEVHGGQLSALGFDGYDDYTNINNIDDALDAIKYAPTVNQWIPCSERLPEKDNLYLVTRLFLGEASVNCRFYYTEEFGGHWGTYETGKVIAWCELPEPYKEINNG